MAKYRVELLERLQLLRDAKVNIKKQMLNIYLQTVKKEETALSSMIKKSIEDVLCKDPEANTWEDEFFISDEIFDFIAFPNEDIDLRRNAVSMYLEEILKEMDFQFLKRNVFVLRTRTNWFSRLMAKIHGIRTQYGIGLWTIELQDGIKGISEPKEAGDRFIARIKDGTLKPIEEPGERFRKLAAETGVSPKEAAEDVERVHTGQPPKYIKIEKPTPSPMKIGADCNSSIVEKPGTGANKHGN